jgi:hypothetical protein
MEAYHGGAVTGGIRCRAKIVGRRSTMQQGQQGQGLGQTPESPAAVGAGQGGKRRYRSLFWPVILIGTGVFALLLSLDVIQAASLGMLTFVWPILLIGFGVDLLFGRRSLLAGGLVGLVTVALVVGLMLIGPAAGWTGDTELKTETFATPVGRATEAGVTIGTGGYSANIHALPASDSPERLLLDAALAFRGTVELLSTGEGQRVVSLEAKDQRWWWTLLDLAETATWDIGLDSGVPLDLAVNSSSGSVELDLSALTLKGVDANMSSGDMDVLLPVAGWSAEAYQAALDISSGDLEVEAPAGARLQRAVHSRPRSRSGAARGGEEHLLRQHRLAGRHSAGDGGGGRRRRMGDTGLRRGSSQGGSHSGAYEFGQREDRSRRVRERVRGR